MTRIHVPLDEAEKERFRQQAAREGKTLAAWLRDAAREKLAAAEPRVVLDTADDLRAFFAACSARETAREPAWEEHRRVIEGSIRSGGSDS
jgi:hypothetical protein